MNVNTKITEEDIFKYVFYLKSLDAEKKMFINNNFLKYSQEIEFCREMKKEEENELPQIIIDKLFSRIYENSKIITLYPQIEKKNEQKMLLAAASNSEENQITTITLFDENKVYVMKVLKYNDNIQIFVFSNKLEDIKKYKVKFYTPNNEYFCENENISLPTEEINKIEKVELEIEQ